MFSRLIQSLLLFMLSSTAGLTTVAVSLSVRRKRRLTSSSYREDGGGLSQRWRSQLHWLNVIDRFQLRSVSRYPGVQLPAQHGAGILIVPLPTLVQRFWSSTPVLDWLWQIGLPRINLATYGARASAWCRNHLCPSSFILFHFLISVCLHVKARWQYHGKITGM